MVFRQQLVQFLHSPIRSCSWPLISYLPRWDTMSLPPLSAWCYISPGWFTHLQVGWLHSLTVMMLDLRSWGHWFDSRLDCCQVVSSCMGYCLWTLQLFLFWYITNTKVNSAFHPPVWVN